MTRRRVTRRPLKGLGFLSLGLGWNEKRPGSLAAALPPDPMVVSSLLLWGNYRPAYCFTQVSNLLGPSCLQTGWSWP